MHANSEQDEINMQTISIFTYVNVQTHTHACTFHANAYKRKQHQLESDFRINTIDLSWPWRAEGSHCEVIRVIQYRCNGQGGD